MTEIESKVVEAWKKAADDLAIRFSSPFTVVTRDGHRLECIGFVHNFGRRIGTIISALDQPSSLDPLFGHWNDENYFISILGATYGEYERQSFIDTLDDWQFFGPDSERPSWYTGKYRGQESDDLNRNR